MVGWVLSRELCGGVAVTRCRRSNPARGFRCEGSRDLTSGLVDGAGIWPTGRGGYGGTRIGRLTNDGRVVVMEGSCEFEEGVKKRNRLGGAGWLGISQ